MARSQLELNIGADNRQAKHAIKEIKKEGVDAADEIQAKNNEATKQVLGMFAPMAIAVQGLMSLIAGIGESIRKYFAQGEVFIEWGKKADISAQSVAYLKAQADAAGVSAKDFEQAMADLGAGKTTIAKLREEWEGLGDSIKTASEAQANFEKLARSKNFTLFGDSQSTFWGGLADGAMEMVGFGGRELAAIQRAAYEGKSFEEAVAEGRKARKGYSLGVSNERKMTAYYEAVANRQADETATQKRAMEETAKKLYAAEIDEEKKVQLFKDQTGIELTAKAIDELAQSLKTRDEKFNDELKYATEEKKKADEEEKKRKDELEKFNDEVEKIGQGVKQTFTSGGGLIGNANYGFKFGDWTQEQLKQMHEQVNLSREQLYNLKIINKALMED